MDDQFIRDRITQLRLKKNVSEYKMSFDLGHSRGYINNISSGKALPSMSEFLYICDYFEISPSEFFDVDAQQPALTSNIIRLSKNLEEESLQAILTIMKKLSPEKVDREA